jgi:GWxTD domain-containing protein
MMWRAALALCASALTSPLVAQNVWQRANEYGPRGADTLSAGAIADSLAVLKMLDSLVRREPNNAEAWYRRGMVAWALAVRDTIPPPVGSTDWRWLGHLADTSFRRAALAAPTDPRYHLATGRYLLASGDPFARTGAGTHFGRAVEAARGGSDAWALADAAIEHGRVAWRRYDQFAFRVPTSSGALRALTDGLQSDGIITGTLRSIVDGARDAARFFDVATAEAGAGYYLQAEQLFREALSAAPDHPRAFRQLAMLLAEKARWTELAPIARERTTRAPWDPLGWMTLGLALHRRGDLDAATTAYEQAVNAMEPADVARLDQLERILRPTDASAQRQSGGDDRSATARAYWMFADPLWSQSGNEVRVEFLARVTFSELRWTVEELGVRGADSDRGDVHIRYGPPDIQLAWGGEPDGPNMETRNISILWAYERSDLAFVFMAPPSFATARVPMIDRQLVLGIQEAIPVRFDNTTRLRIDSLPVRVTRFRATADSVDLVVAALPPIDSIAAASIVREPVRTDLWVLGEGLNTVHRDSIPTSTAGQRDWRRRVQVGSYVYRLEASASASERAARATAPIVAETDPATGFATAGFGVSDLLLATRARERRGVAPRRWSDLDIEPQVGAMRAGSGISLVWETYGLAATDGGSEYTVTITARRERGTAGRVTARILGGVPGRAAVTAGRDQVVIAFDRAVPAAPAVVDFFELSLAESPEGRYVITLAVTDKATGVTSERSTVLEIAR